MSFARTLGPRLTEEPLDMLVFRPLGYVLVRLVAPLRITPNQLSLGSAVAGIAAAVLVARARGAPSLFAAGLVLASVLLDNADGQLARFRGAKSHAGWVFDAICDGSKGVAIFFGVAIALHAALGSGALLWAVGAGLSTLAQVLTRDRVLHDFETAAGLNPESPQAREARIAAERASLRATPWTLAAFAMHVYDVVRALGAGTGVSRRIATSSRPALDSPAFERRATAQTLWRHLGGTAQLVVLAAGVAAGASLVACQTIVLLGDAFLMVALFVELRARAVGR